MQGLCIIIINIIIIISHVWVVLLKASIEKK